MYNKILFCLQIFDMKIAYDFITIKTSNIISIIKVIFI